MLYFVVDRLCSMTDLGITSRLLREVQYEFTNLDISEPVIKYLHTIPLQKFDHFDLYI